MEALAHLVCLLQGHSCGAHPSPSLVRIQEFSFSETAYHIKVKEPRQL